MANERKRERHRAGSKVIANTARYTEPRESSAHLDVPSFLFLFLLLFFSISELYERRPLWSTIPPLYAKADMTVNHKDLRRAPRIVHWPPTRFKAPHVSASVSIWTSSKFRELLGDEARRSDTEQIMYYISSLSLTVNDYISSSL